MGKDHVFIRLVNALKCLIYKSSLLQSQLSFLKPLGHSILGDSVALPYHLWGHEAGTSPFMYTALDACCRDGTQAGVHKAD